MTVKFHGPHILCPQGRIVEKFTGEEKDEKDPKTGRTYKSQARILRMFGMGWEEKKFFFPMGAKDAFDKIPDAAAAGEKLFDVVIPLNKDKDGKQRLGVPMLFPADSVQATRAQVGTVASALDESQLPGTGRRAA